MANQEHNTTPEVKMESEEVSEILSQDTEMVTEEEDVVSYDFLPSEPFKEEATPKKAASKKEEVITTGQTKVIFREPTEEDLPTKEVPLAESGFIGKDYFSDMNEWQATVVGKTPSGNQLQITKRREGTGYELSLRNGGTMPAKYTGWYTTYEKAEEAARLFLSLQWEEARTKGTKVA